MVGPVLWPSPAEWKATVTVAGWHGGRRAPVGGNGDGLAIRTEGDHDKGRRGGSKLIRSKDDRRFLEPIEVPEQDLRSRLCESPFHPCVVW